MSQVTVSVTRHFTRNLDAVKKFLREDDTAPAFAFLLDDLFNKAIPALEMSPDLGREVLAYQPSSRETVTLAANLLKRLGSGTCLRELVRGDYLLLYACSGDDLYLLAIEHHRQLSFDALELWGA